MKWYELDGLDFIERREKESDVRMFTSPYDVPRRVGGDRTNRENFQLWFDYGTDEPRKWVRLHTSDPGHASLSVGKRSGRLYMVELKSPRNSASQRDLKRSLQLALKAWGKRTHNRDNFNVARRVANRLVDQWSADLLSDVHSDPDER